MYLTTEKRQHIQSIIRNVNSKFSTGHREPTWTKAVPHDMKPEQGPRVIMKSMSIAGDYLFMVGVDTRAQVRVFDMKDGRFVGMLDPGEEVSGIDATGWIDMVDAIHTVQRTNGDTAFDWAETEGETGHRF